MRLRPDSRVVLPRLQREDSARTRRVQAQGRQDVRHDGDEERGGFPRGAGRPGCRRGADSHRRLLARADRSRRDEGRQARLLPEANDPRHIRGLGYDRGGKGAWHHLPGRFAAAQRTGVPRSGGDRQERPAWRMQVMHHRPVLRPQRRAQAELHARLHSVASAGLVQPEGIHVEPLPGAR